MRERTSSVGRLGGLTRNHHRVTNMLLKDFLSLPTPAIPRVSDPDRVNDPDHPNDEEGHDRGDEDIDEIRWDSELDAAQAYRAEHVEREHVEKLKIVGEDVRERYVEGERGRANDLERHVKGLEVSAVEDGATELSKPALVESV